MSLLAIDTSQNQDGDSVILEEEIDPNYEPTEEEIIEYANWLGMDVDADKDLWWIARQGLKAPLPENWKPCKTTDTEEIYYFNFATGATTWDHPCDEYHRNLYEEEKKKLGNRGGGFGRGAGSGGSTGGGNNNAFGSDSPGSLTLSTPTRTQTVDAAITTQAGNLAELEALLMKQNAERTYTKTLLRSATTGEQWDTVSNLAKTMKTIDTKIQDTTKKFNLCKARCKAVNDLKGNKTIQNATCSTTTMEEEEPDNKNCMICMDAKANCVAIPCGHVCGCLTCMSKLKRKPCPICRVRIQNVQQIYMSVETATVVRTSTKTSLRQESSQLATPCASVGITREDALAVKTGMKSEDARSLLSGQSSGALKICATIATTEGGTGVDLEIVDDDEAWFNQ